MDFTCRRSYEKKLKPFFPATGYSEEIDSSCNMSKHFSSKWILVAHFNVNFMFQVHDLNIHELECPMRPLTPFKANFRSPFSSIDLDDDEGAHTFKVLVSVIDVRFNQVQLQISYECTTHDHRWRSNLLHNNRRRVILHINWLLALFNYSSNFLLGCNHYTWCVW